MQLDSVYGQAWNQNRLSARVMLWYPGLKVEMADSTGITWRNISYDSIISAKMPVHKIKFLHLKNGKPISEEDCFESGKRWQRNEYEDGQNFPERLTITYYYDTTGYYYTTALGKCCPPWYCRYSNAPVDKNVTIQQADSILNSWKINRLNPK
jgi:hypothetical protein